MSRTGGVEGRDVYPAMRECSEALPLPASGGDSDAYRAVGLDRLTICGRVDWSGRLWTHKVPNAWGAHVSVLGGFARIDFNPSRVYSNRQVPCPVGELADVLENVLDRVKASVPCVSSLRERSSQVLQVTRADLVRDFSGVAHSIILMEGLRHVDRSKRMEARDFRNQVVHGTSNSLSIGLRQRLTLYDRHRKDPSRLPAGVVRFEVRARKAWLAKAGLLRLDGFTLERVEHFLRDRWDLALFGTKVIREDSLLEAVSRQPWTQREKAFFFWLESCRLRGLDVAMDSRTKARHRWRQTQVGVVGPVATSEAIWLDFASGTEIVESRADTVRRHRPSTPKSSGASSSVPAPTLYAGHSLGERKA